jgi:hypothetical protein
VERGVLTTVHHSSLTQEEFLKIFGLNLLASAIFSVVSISFLYSYLAIESFINYQLYRALEKDSSEESIQCNLWRRCAIRSPQDPQEIGQARRAG